MNLETEVASLNREPVDEISQDDSKSPDVSSPAAGRVIMGFFPKFYPSGKKFFHDYSVP